MTKSNITRERAQQIFLGNGPEPSASEERELARIALAAMDSESDCKGRELFCSTDTARMRKVISASAGTEDVPLYRHAQLEASHLSRICAESYQVVGALAETLRIFNDVSVIKALDNLSAQELIHDDVLPFSVPESAQPVQEVIPECFRNAVSALESLYRNGQKQCWNERYTTDMAYAHGVLNACRAAILTAAPQSPGSEPATVQGKWIPVSERMPEAEGHYLVWANASRIDGYCDHLAIAMYQGGEWSNEFNWLVTHWMPLPAAPQKLL